MRLMIATITLLMSAACFSAPPPLSAYGSLPQMDYVVLSPSGRQLAFISSAGGKRSLQVQTTEGANLIRTPVDALKVRRLEWAGDELLLLSISRSVSLGRGSGAAFDLAQVLALDLKTRSTRSISAGGPWLDAVFGSYGLSYTDGHWRGAFRLLPAQRTVSAGRSGARRSNAQLVSVDLRSGEFRKLDGGSSQAADWLVGKDGTVLANARYDDRSRQWRLFAGAGSRRLIDRVEDPLGQNRIIGQGRVPGTVLYLRLDGDGVARYVEAALSAQTRPVEILPDITVHGFVYDRNSGLLAGVNRVADTQALQLLDPARDAGLRAVRQLFPGVNVSFGSWSDDFRHAVIFTEGLKDSGSWWLVDISSGKTRRLGSVYPQVYGEQIGAFSMIDYQAADGLRLRGVLTLPPGHRGSKLPVVVLPHGGPEARSYPEFSWWAQAYASRGYAVWQPNFRGSSGYGVGVRLAGNGQWGRRMQTDISDGVAELARRGIVDPKRACIVGASYGGYAALAGVTVQQGLYRCAVAVAAVSDLGSHLQWVGERAGRDAMRYLLAFTGARSPQDPALAQISPAQLAGGADAPLLLIHGRDDTVVRIEQSLLMMRAMQQAGQSVEILVLDGEDHHLSREPTRLAMLTAAVQFVQRHNPATP